MKNTIRDAEPFEKDKIISEFKDKTIGTLLSCWGYRSRLMKHIFTLLVVGLLSVFIRNNFNRLAFLIAASFINYLCGKRIRTLLSTQ